MGNTEPETVRAWFLSLAYNLLPDNDEVFSRKNHEVPVRTSGSRPLRAL